MTHWRDVPSGDEKAHSETTRRYEVSPRLRVFFTRGPADGSLWPGVEAAAAGKAQDREFWLAWAPLGGISRACAQLLGEIRTAARGDQPVLIVGPAGTEMVAVARAIHASSRRRAEPLAIVEGCDLPSLAALVETVHGLPAQLLTGTVLVTNLDSLDPETDGGMEELLRHFGVDASNAWPSPELHPRLFLTRRECARQQDCSFGSAPAWLSRLTVLQVSALDTRRCDIPILAAQILLAIAWAAGSEPKYLAPEALGHLMARAWPGNVRELAEVLLRAARRSEGAEIGLAEVAADEDYESREGAGACKTGQRGLAELLAELSEGMEAHVIATALARTRNNRTRAAHILRIGRRTLLYKLQKHPFLGRAALGRPAQRG